MFGAIFGGIINAVSGHLLDSVEGMFRDYISGKITREQLVTELGKAMLATFAQIEVAHAQSISATFSSFMQAAAQSKFMQHVWGTVALSQLFVLFWYQWIVPALTQLALVKKYPSPGTTIEWAYALIIFCIGGGAIALKTGPGASAIADQIKALAGKVSI